MYFWITKEQVTTSEQKHSVFYWKQLWELCHSLRPPSKSVITDHEKPSVTPLASQWFWKLRLLHGISSWIEPGYLDMGWGTIKPTGQIWPTLRDLNGTQTCPLTYGCVWLPLQCWWLQGNVYTYLALLGTNDQRLPQRLCSSYYRSLFEVCRISHHKATLICVNPFQIQSIHYKVACFLKTQTQF